LQCASEATKNALLLEPQIARDIRTFRRLK
jgi:hypothetical protein